MWRKYQRYGILFFSITAVFIFFRYYVPFFIPKLGFLMSVMSPFLVAAFLAMLLEPLVELLETRLKMSRTMGTSIVVFGLVGIILTIITVAVAQLTLEAIAFKKALPQYQESFSQVVKETVDNGIRLYKQGSDIYEVLPEQFHDTIESNITQINTKIEAIATDVVNGILNFAKVLPGGITSFITVIIVTLIATFFILKDKAKVIDFWIRTVPKPYGKKTLHICIEIFGAFSRYLRAQLILISITMTQSIIGLYIIGTEYALSMGLLIGFMDLIPVLGPSSVFIPWIGWVLYQGNMGFGIKLLVLYIIILIVRQVLESKVVADSLGLHPLATLIAMYIGLKTLGFVGFVAGPILVIAGQAVAKAGLVKIQ